MKKTIATLALLASTVAALATDLPSKSKAPAAPLPILTQETSFYVGGNLGGNLREDAQVYSGGVVAGYTVMPFFVIEGTYDFSRPQNKVHGEYNYGNMVAVNVVPQYKLPLMPVTIYALGGVGYRWNTQTDNQAVYNIGAGVKYEVIKNFDVDVRYRRIEGFNSSARNPEDRGTIGLNYKF
jgi:opacity protein-like surface antigen